MLPLPLIRNEKTVDPRDKTTPKVFQLETAMGAAIECFEGAAAIQVPRNRFAPVKSTADLLSVRSDAYELDPEFRLELIPDRSGTPPNVKLGDRYKLVDQFEELVKELNLTSNIVPLQPSNLALPDHMDGFVALNRSTSCWNSRNPCLAFTRRLIARWSCSRMLFKYCTGRCRQRRRSVPSFCRSGIAEP